MLTVGRVWALSGRPNAARGASNNCWRRAHTPGLNAPLGWSPIARLLIEILGAYVVGMGWQGREAFALPQAIEMCREWSRMGGLFLQPDRLSGGNWFTGRRSVIGRLTYA